MKKGRLVRMVCLGLLVAALAACGNGESAFSQAAFQSEEIPVIAPIPEPVQEPEPEPEPVYPYTNPLTGEGLMEDISGKRPIAVMFNNLEKALPQLGVGQADVIYESVAEGGITRMMGLFQDIQGAGDLGSIRSARDYYVTWPTAMTPFMSTPEAAPRPMRPSKAGVFPPSTSSTGRVGWTAGGISSAGPAPGMSTPCLLPAPTLWSRCPPGSGRSIRRAIRWAGPLTRKRRPGELRPPS